MMALLCPHIKTQNIPKKIFLFISLTLMLFSHKLHVNLLVFEIIFSTIKCQVIKFLFFISLWNRLIFHCVKMSQNSCDLMFGDDWHNEVSEQGKMPFSDEMSCFYHINHLFIITNTGADS